MKTALLTTIIALGSVSLADAQCATCTPSQPAPTAAHDDHTPKYVWVKQRCGLLGLQRRWRLVRVYDYKPANVIGVVPRR